MTQTATFLRDLIALPSVNPAFLPEGDARAGEKRVADFLLATAAKAGLDVEFQPVLPDRSNILAHLTPVGKITQRIILAPHTDTVGGPELDQLLQPVEKNGRLYGRGSCDTKGCIAAMLTAVMNVAKSAQRPQHTEIIFVGLVDEENGQAGSRAFAKSGFKADLAIVGEPTELIVVTAHKGDLWLRIETRGRSAHGARPELGRNAVHTMARLVDLLETTYARELRKRRHPLLGTGTINTGVIRGGLQANIVPDQCAITIDRRTIPGETEAGVRRELMTFFRQHKIAATIADNKGVACLPLETNFKLPLVQQFLRSANQSKPAGVRFFCDASILAQGGIPSIVFGPGNIAQAHTAEEWISLASLEKGARMLTRYLQSLP